MGAPPSRNLGRQPSYVSYRTLKPHYDAVDEGTEGCARVCQLMLFVVATAAVTLGLISILSCEFVIYILPSILTNSTETPETTISQNATETTWSSNLIGWCLEGHGG
jgi:hypothetical protein